MHNFKPTFNQRKKIDMAHNEQFKLFSNKMKSFLISLEKSGYIANHEDKEINISANALCKELLEAFIAPTEYKVDNSINTINDLSNKIKKNTQDIDLIRENDKLYKEGINNSLKYGFFTITIFNIISIIGYLKYLPQFV